MKNPRSRAARRVFGVFALLVLLVMVGGAFRYRHDLRQVQKSGVRETLKTVYYAVKKARADAQAALLPLPERADGPMMIIAGTLGDGWQDWSWATHTGGVMPNAHSGTSAVRMTPDANKGVYFHHDAFSTGGYGFLTFAVKSQSPLMIVLYDGGGKTMTTLPIASTGGVWAVKRIPLSQFGVIRTGTQISGVVFQDATGTKQADAFLDDVALLPDPALAAPPTSATVAVSVDTHKNLHPISPYIYGMAFAPPDYLTDLKITVNRWGGNDKTRYNWALGNACNAARDWRFANRKASDGPFKEGASSAADYFIDQNKVGGAQTLLTVPTIGWVAKDTDNNHTSENVPPGGGEPLPRTDGAVAGYDPTVNRARTSVRSVPRAKNARLGDVAQDAWVNHLIGKYGTAQNGGVKFYAMDNEPDLWDGTHTDVHPARMGYDDLLSMFYEYGTAVKDADPSAQITGPVSWGWTGYIYSPLDRGNDNFHTHADRTKHDNTPFLLWFLQQAKNRDTKAGRRILDVLDVHYYPQGQGLYGQAHDADAQKRRLRATRSLWDAAYPDESWIGEPIRLLPRLKEWVNQGYPGTKIGITEWNFGADTDISGGLTTLDALAIFGRENVYVANFWAYPGKNGPAYLAFKLMRNADNQGHGFGDTSAQAASADQDRVSAYAATSKTDGVVTVLLVNKLPKATVSVPVRFAPGSLPASAKSAIVYRLTQMGKEITKDAAPVAVQNNAMTVSLPPHSAALVRIVSPPAPQ